MNQSQRSSRKFMRDLGEAKSTRLSNYPIKPKEKKPTDFSIGADHFDVAPPLDETFGRDSNFEFSKTSLLQGGAISIHDASKESMFMSLYGELGLKTDYSSSISVNRALTKVPDGHGSIKQTMDQLKANKRRSMRN